MTYDRTYWRACSDTRLIEEARDSGHELTIALGERLEDTAVKDERAYKMESDYLATIDCLRAELACAERTISSLLLNTGEEA